MCSDSLNMCCFSQWVLPPLAPEQMADRVTRKITGAMSIHAASSRVSIVSLMGET